MDSEDPINQFFPDQENVDLYAVLGVESSANAEEIRKSYRKRALLNHPDKHVSSSDEAKAAAATTFQQISFAYAVLGDDKRRARYDKTGQTSEGFDIEGGEEGWERYFEELFERVTRAKLDEMKVSYQNSQEEVDDLATAYSETNGSIAEILTHIPFSTYEDEARFTKTINDLIKAGTVPDLPEWRAGIKDTKAKAARKREGKKEAQEAELLAKDLGVWDEFYGSGKEGPRKGKGSKKDAQGEDGDVSALQALILAKKKKADTLFDDIAAKYAGTGAKKSGKKRGAAGDGANANKKSRQAEEPPEIDDEEFARLQEKLFSKKK